MGVQLLPIIVMVRNLIAQMHKMDLARLANQTAINIAQIMEVPLIGVNSKTTAIRTFV